MGSSRHILRSGSLGDAAGDLYYGLGDYTAEILPIGTAGKVLGVNDLGTLPKWKPVTISDIGDVVIPSGGSLKITGAVLGDLFYADSVGTLTRLPIGTTGQVLKVSGGIPVWSSATVANNIYGTASAVAVGATATIVSYVAGSSYRFSGFVVRGDGDGRYFVQYDGVTVYALMSNIAEPQATLTLPTPDAAAAGKTVTLKVTNAGTATSDFEGTLLGE